MRLWGWAGPPLTRAVLCCPLTSLQYVRLSQDTPPSVIYHLMTQYWGLDVPNLLISVTGGAKDFNMKPRLKSIFRRGLVKVAQTTGSLGVTLTRSVLAHVAAAWLGCGAASPSQLPIAPRALRPQEARVNHELMWWQREEAEALVLVVGCQ